MQMILLVKLQHVYIRKSMRKPEKELLLIQFLILQLSQMKTIMHLCLMVPMASLNLRIHSLILIWNLD